jgi:flavin reductase (DIM6/NTAB) family NADH-FMN oxidoreductase RutF
MRIQLKPEEFFHLINHGPCSLITTGIDHQRNVSPIAWTTPLNDEPPLMAIVVADSHHTSKLIKESGEFVVNVVGENLTDQLFSCGKCHGDKIDKFKKFGLTPIPSSTIKTPYIREAIAHIECKLIHQHPYDGVHLYVGKVLHAEVEEEFWDGKSIIVEKAKTIHHLTGNRFAVTERVIEAKKMYSIPFFFSYSR